MEETKLNRIIQSGTINGLTFSEGDILKVEMEDGGTKNVYYGKFVTFDIKRGIKYLLRGETKIRLLFRHHTCCNEGLFHIDIDEISKIEILKKNSN